MEVTLNPKIFRPKSSMDELETNFIIHEGGLGDYVAYMACIVWIAKNHPQCRGHLYVSDFFFELATFFMHPFGSWTVYPYSTLTKEIIKTRPTLGPYRRPISGIGSHPVDLAFIYYLNQNPAAEDAYYPQYKDYQNRLTETPFDLPKDYAVMCPGVGGKNRELYPEAFQEIKLHLLEKGITPVFIGKKEISMRRVLYFPKYDLSGGIDLIDQTNLVQGLDIISKAKLIVGLDNGLLHLAGCTEIPIIFGYTIASPQHRRPRRPRGAIYEITPDERYLTCTFCQSKMRLIFNHDFSECLYKDYECLNNIAESKRWVGAIDAALGESI